MSDIISAKVKNTVSPLLRSVNSISMEDDIRPAMRSSELYVMDVLRGLITNNQRKYKLGAHADKGVKSKPWSLSTTSKTFGFTVYLSAREWLYIFNDGTYLTGKRKTKKAYKTAPYTDKLGRHIGERKYKVSVNRGAIPALKYMDYTRSAVGGVIFDKLRNDIARAVNARLNRMS